MAERNDWDRNRDREQEMDRERGGRRLDSQRNQESRGYDAGRWENEGGRNEGEREGRGNFPRYEDRSRNYGEDERRERGEWSGNSSVADFGHRGDWGRQGSWGTYGNRPGSERHEGQGGYGGRQSDFTGRSRYEGQQHNQMGGMSAGYSSGMWSSGYGGGAGSYSGGLGEFGEQGRHAGRGPKNWQRSDDRIREDVNERLTDHPHIDASEIDVEVKNGEVTLTGTVEDRRTKRMAEDLVEGISGVKEVHNHLRANSGSQQQGTDMAKSGGTQSGGTQNAQTQTTGSQSRK